jgi:hypothetical protein
MTTINKVTTENNNTPTLFWLPRELIAYIGSLADGQGLHSFSNTCKAIYKIFSEEVCERHLRREVPLLKDLPHTFTLPFSAQIPGFWKSVWICKKDGVISNKPASEKHKIFLLSLNPAPLVQVPTLPSEATYRTESLKELGWNNALRYFVKILTVFERVFVVNKKFKILP